MIILAWIAKGSKGKGISIYDTWVVMEWGVGSIALGFFANSPAVIISLF